MQCTLFTIETHENNTPYLEIRAPIGILALS